MIVSSLLTTMLVVAFPGPAPPIRTKTSWSEVGFAVVRRCVLGADLDQGLRVHRTRVDQEARELHPGHVTDLDRGHPVVRDDRGQAEAEGHGVRAVDGDRLVDVVDAGREQQVQALLHGRVDGGGVRPLLHDVELVQRNRLARRRPVAPGDAARVLALLRDEDLVVVAVEVEERLLAGDGRGVQGGVRRLREAVGRGALDTRERHVPDAVAPAAHRAVAGVPLLLGVRADLAVDLAVGDVAAAGPAVAVGCEVESALDVHPAERGRLGDRPAVGAGDRVEGQVLRRTPEVLRGVAVEPARVHGHITVERGVVRVQPETRDLRVEADLRVDVVVRARLEHQRVTVGAELRGLLLLEDLVDLALDVGRGRVEDMDVGTEVAAARHRLDLLAEGGLCGGYGHEHRHGERGESEGPGAAAGAWCGGGSMHEVRLLGRGTCARRTDGRALGEVSGERSLVTVMFPRGPVRVKRCASGASEDAAGSNNWRQVLGTWRLRSGGDGLWLQKLTSCLVVGVDRRARRARGTMGP